MLDSVVPHEDDGLVVENGVDGALERDGKELASDRCRYVTGGALANETDDGRARVREIQEEVLPIFSRVAKTGKVGHEIGIGAAGGTDYTGVGARSSDGSGEGSFGHGRNEVGMVDERELTKFI